MSSATMPLMALYNYDNTIFDGLTFPAGIDKDTAIDEIIIRSGEFEMLYPDPNFIKPMITHWGKKHYRTFEKWIDALNIDFEPLYNFDRYEEYTDEKVAQGNTKANTSSTDNSNSIDSTSESVNNDSSTSSTTNDLLNALTKDKANSASQTTTDSSTSETNTRNVSAYDSATYQPREQEVKSTTSGQTGSGSAQNESESDSLNIHNTESNNVESGNTNRSGNTVRTGNNSSSSEQNTASTNTEQNKHTAHLYGNIGVTTSTQLLEDYIRVERFCIYEQIADIFVDEFCIMIY